jgi:hypothetical protein
MNGIRGKINKILKNINIIYNKNRNKLMEFNKELNLKKFDITKMVDNPTIVIIAKRGSGKSFLAKDILYNLNLPSGIIISKTEKVDPFYINFVPDSYIYNEFNSRIIEKIIKRQCLLVEKIKKIEHCRHIKYNKKNIRTSLVMDDCLSDKQKWSRDENISNLLLNGRHYEITYILTMQYPLGIPPDLRANFDYVFIMADNIVSNIKKIYEHYAGIFPDINIFRTMLNKVTKDYGCLVIDKRGTSDNFLDKVFWYEAKEYEEKYIGMTSYVEYHNDNYNNNWKNENVCNNLDNIINNNKIYNNIKINKINNNI